MYVITTHTEFPVTCTIVDQFLARHFDLVSIRCNSQISSFQMQLTTRSTTCHISRIVVLGYEGYILRIKSVEYTALSFFLNMHESRVEE